LQAHSPKPAFGRSTVAPEGLKVQSAKGKTNEAPRSKLQGILAKANKNFECRIPRFWFLTFNF